MSVKKLCGKELKIQVQNKSKLINKCQYDKNEYFEKRTKNKKYNGYYKKCVRKCLTSLEFINKQKINAKLGILTLRCKNKHQIIKKLGYSKNKGIIVNLKN